MRCGKNFLCFLFEKKREPRGQAVDLSAGFFGARDCRLGLAHKRKVLRARTPPAQAKRIKKTGIFCRLAVGTVETASKKHPQRGVFCVVPLTGLGPVRRVDSEGF